MLCKYHVEESKKRTYHGARFRSQSFPRLVISVLYPTIMHYVHGELPLSPYLYTLHQPRIRPVCIPSSGNTISCRNLERSFLVLDQTRPLFLGLGLHTSVATRSGTAVPELHEAAEKRWLHTRCCRSTQPLPCGVETGRLNRGPRECKSHVCMWFEAGATFRS